MYWGDELVAIYNEAYIGKSLPWCSSWHRADDCRSRGSETSYINGAELQSRVGGDLG